MRRCSTAALLVFLAPAALFGQGITNGLDVFGYFQSTFDHSFETTSIMDFPPTTTARNTFILQQANLFFRRQFGAKFTAFVNTEFTNTYSSSRGWGSFRIEEGWVWYEPTEAFSVKAGLLTPTFNNLNEIKNRMPLLPYITRPIVYEAAAEAVNSVDEFIPASAFLQLQGTVPINDVRLDYALYAGNGDPTFTTSGQQHGSYTIGGIDTTTFKLVGTRIGIRAGKVKLGYSMTSDKSNRSDIGLGAIQRYRFGGDLSFQVGPVFVESEFIATKELISDAQLQVYRAVAVMNPTYGTNPNNLFTYGVLTYDISDLLYAFGGFEYMRVHESSITRGIMAGGGFRPIDQVVVKLEYFHLNNEIENLSSYRFDRLEVGVSVMF